MPGTSLGRMAPKPSEASHVVPGIGRCLCLAMHASDIGKAALPAPLGTLPCDEGQTHGGERRANA